MVCVVCVCVSVCVRGVGVDVGSGSCACVCAFVCLSSVNSARECQELQRGQCTSGQDPGKMAYSAPAVGCNPTQVPLPPPSPLARPPWLQGSGVHSSTVMKGLVFKREVEGVISEMKKAKVAVYSCPYDAQGTETKVRKVLANDCHGNQSLSSTVCCLQLPWILACHVSHTLALPV